MKKGTRQPASYVQPIHFEDFSGLQFERLVFAYHARAEKWRSLEWYGQSGSDLGRDIWGVRDHGAEADESVCVQCVNRVRLTFAKVKADLSKVLSSANGVPSRFRIAAVSNVSASMRDKIKKHVLSTGVKDCDIWSGTEFEEFLRHGAESLLKRFVEGEAFPDAAPDLFTFAQADGSLAQQVRAATSAVIATWSGRLARNPFIELRAVKIDPDGRDTTEAFHLSEVCAALTQGRRFVIEAPAGRGKTTTLAYLANAHSSAGHVAFIVNLPGWIASKKHILEFIAGLLPFFSRGIGAASLARLCSAEHCSFFLNGWNEIAESESTHAVERLRELVEDFPAASLLIATRTQRVNPPLPGATRVRLLPFDRAQRTQYLCQRLGGRYYELAAKLDGDPVLDDLTRTPLILLQVTDLFAADMPIPDTKMGVIEAAMALLERNTDHSSQLQSVPLSGLAKEYLIELASALTERGGVEMPEPDARATIGKVSRALRTDEQIASPPDQAVLLDALCNHHVLDRVEYPVVSFRFAHQQFQEFYAALLVKRQLPELLTSPERSQRFTSRFINVPAWLEPLRMIAAELACAGISSADSLLIDRKICALVERALETDYVFAAELFRLCNAPSGSPTGRALHDRLRFLYGLPDEHFRQLALAAMFESGSDRFTDIILPLLTNTDPQIRLGVYRLLGGIHVSSLGPQWRETVSGWPEDTRVDFFSEMLHFGDGPHKIVPFALADPSPKVHAVAISALDWLGSRDDLARALKTADDATFETAVKELPPEDIPEEVRPRIVGSYESRYRDAADPVMRLQIGLKLTELGNTTAGSRFKEDLNDCEREKIGASWHAVIEPALKLVQRTDPGWVSRWVADRIADGAAWVDDWKKFVTAVPLDLKERLLQRLETEDFKHVRHPPFVDLLAAAADSEMVERVFTKLFELHLVMARAPAELHELEWAVQGQLEELFRALPADVAAIGLSMRFSRDVKANELMVVTRLFGSIGRQDFDARSPFRGDLRQLLRAYFKRAVPVVLSDEAFGSRDIGNLISALARVGEPEDLEVARVLIQTDIFRGRKAREEAARTRAHGLRHTASEDCSPWNVRAVALLDPDGADAVLLDLLREPEYERVAASALLQLARTEKTEEGFGKQPDYRELWEARARRQPVGFNESRRKRYAAAVADRIITVLGQRTVVKEPAPYEFRLKEMAKVLAALDAVGSTALILRVLSLPERVTSWSWQSLKILETLLFNGVVLPAEETLTWFDSVLERVRPQRYDTQQVGLVLQALCLLPFVDTPVVGIARIREVVADLKLLGHQLRGVTIALGHSRCSEAVGLLREFISGDNAAGKIGNEWINAIAALDTSETRQLLMSFIDRTVPGIAAEAALEREDALVARLVELGRNDPTIEQRILQLCDLSLPVRKRSLLSKVVASFDSAEATLAGLNLIDDNATPPLPYEVWKQIEGVFVEHRSQGKDSNIYTLAPRSSNAIRERILQLASKDVRRKKEALSLLGQIELWRLQYGRPHGEPRNPAFGSGLPWPPADA